MEIRIAKDEEFGAISKMVERSVRACFPKFYPPCSVEYVVEETCAENLRKRAEFTNFYVVKEGKEVVGCGAIGPLWGSEVESSLFTIFVDPNHQGKGIGRKIMETLESDFYAKRARRIEIPASMFAIPFYKKMGYEHKNGELNFEDGHFKMEKYKDIEQGN